MDAKITKHSILLRCAVIMGLIMLTGACATTSKVAAPDTSKAEANIQQASEADAQEYAPLDLRNARKKLDQAKALVKQEKYAEATRLNEEASVDAELALATARSKKAQEAVKQLRETINTLKQEIKRKQHNQ